MRSMFTKQTKRHWQERQRDVMCFEHDNMRVALSAEEKTGL